MFGYVRIKKDYLIVKDYYLYSKKYCSLCYSIGKEYGTIYRLLTSYDMVLLILCLEIFEDCRIQYKFRCPLNKIKKIEVYNSENIYNYISFINYHLMIEKLNDNILDKKSKLCLILKKFFIKNKKYNFMKSKMNSSISELDEIMKKINLLENRESDLDELLNLFGQYFATLFKMYFSASDFEKNSQYYDINNLLFNYGKWIYLMDAYDDYADDKKNGEFNLLNFLYDNDESKNYILTHRKIKLLNDMLIYKMNASIEKFDDSYNKRIISNMINQGNRNVYLKILKNNYPIIYNDYNFKKM